MGGGFCQRCASSGVLEPPERLSTGSESTESQFIRLTRSTGLQTPLTWAGPGWSVSEPTDRHRKKGL